MIILPNELPLTAIIKVTNSCNMRCRYCYHYDTGYTTGIITRDTLESIFNIILTNRRKTRIIWHGGEPLLGGLNFFKMVLDLESKYTCEVENSIQSNGTLWDEETINFFNDNHFKIGISFDGPMNDYWRGKTAETFHTINLLLNKRGHFGLISVLPLESLQNPDEIYNYYKQLSKDKITVKFNPMTNSGAAITNCLFSGDVDAYFESYSKLFDYWFFDADSDFNISTFSDYLESVCLNKNRLCTISSCLFKFISFSPDGSIYPCGKSYPKEYCLGNVEDYLSLDQIFESSQYNKIAQQSIMRRENCKSSCEYYQFCEGGCNNDSILAGGLLKTDYFECILRQKMIGHVKELLSDQDNVSKCNNIARRIISCK